MTLRTQKEEIKDPNWKRIKNELDKLDGVTYGYLILENGSGDYLQCAGQPEKLTIEHRVSSEAGFKHYVLGKEGEYSPINVSWVVLQTKVGEIMIREEEVMDLKDAKLIFKEYFDNQSIPAELNNRNTTKLHMK